MEHAQKLTTFAAVEEAISTRPDVAPFARIVGRWIWLEFPDKPSLDTRVFIRSIGFRWNSERAAWQHSCGHFTRRNRRIDPRQVYGAQRIERIYGDYVTREQAGPRPLDQVSRELNNFQAI